MEGIQAEQPSASKQPLQQPSLLLQHAIEEEEWGVSTETVAGGVTHVTWAGRFAKVSRLRDHLENHLEGPVAQSRPCVRQDHLEGPVIESKPSVRQDHLEDHLEVPVIESRPCVRHTETTKEKYQAATSLFAPEVERPTPSPRLKKRQKAVISSPAHPSSTAPVIHGFDDLISDLCLYR